MKLALCARVSSERQNIDFSIPVQLKALQQYAPRKEHAVVAECVDEVESGQSTDRPGFKQMIVRAIKY